jgi:LacI family transcriptional regulator
MDLAPVFAEALDILVRYLRIDTSNPPGNEKPAARFLGSLLESEGIECEYIETQPEREILVARLRGDGSKRPIMLCNHTDVVPVEEQYWDMPAFEGVVRDGRVYGRGAIDMKGCGVMQLMAFLLLHRNRVPLTRDVIFCAVPDEEAGSTWGMKWLSEHRPDICDVEFELSEGGGGADRFGGEDVRLFNVATNEKSICWLQLTAVGTPGHGSRIHHDNSLVHLMRALLRLEEWNRGITFTPDTTAYIDRLAEAGHQLLIATHDYSPATEESQAVNLLTRGADALVLCGTGQRPALLARLRARGVPVVHVMSWPPPPGLACVGFDNARAMAPVVRYLMDLGHRRIAMLAGLTRDNDRAAARLTGVRAALEAAGLPLPAGRVVERRYALAEAREGLQRLMEATPPPTAIVCGNDVLAFGALFEAQRLGLQVPRDLSIVGFDDLELASHVQPALTTVHVPAETMWRRAAEHVLALLDGREPPPAAEVEVSFVVRGSTGPVATRASKGAHAAGPPRGR